MSVIALIVLLCFLAAVLYFVNTKFSAMNATIKLIINIVVVAIAVILCLVAFGVWDEIRGMQVPKI